MSDEIRQADRPDPPETAVRRRVAYAERLQPEDLAEIWVDYKQWRAQGKSLIEIYDRLALKYGRPASTIRTYLKRLTPTTDIAAVFLRSKAYEMAERVVKDGKVPELIDVLSRSSLGVIAPKQESGSQGGFFLSVSADSCGAVKIGVAQGAVPQLEEALDASEAIDITPEPTPEPEQEPYDPQPQGRIRQLGQLNPKQEAAVQAARNRLAAAQRSRRRYSKNEGLQDPHADPQSERDRVAGDGEGQIEV